MLKAGYTYIGYNMKIVLVTSSQSKGYSIWVIWLACGEPLCNYVLNCGHFDLGLYILGLKHYTH